ncbi:MAG: hypothetical protein HY762_04355 [Planctomycetes bacterium]|nr:hypothetical protein [Planctomycetota bacterium]
MAKSPLITTGYFNMIFYILRNFILSVLIGLTALGDIITLNSGEKNTSPGRVIEGRLIESNDKHIIMETFGGRRTIPRQRISQHNIKQVSAFEKYEKQIDSLGKDANIELEPENKSLSETVTSLLKSLDRQEKAYLENLPKPRAIILRVGVRQGDLSKEEIERLVNVVKKAAQLLSRISVKQIYLSEVIFTIPSNTGDLVFDKTFTGVPNGWSNIPIGVKDWWAPLIVHELGHSNLTLPDDDNAAAGGEYGKGPYPCIMAHNYDQGYGLCCQKKLNLGQFGKFSDLLEEEIPEPPQTKITINYPGKEPKPK